jgi:elongation factor Ts
METTKITAAEVNNLRKMTGAGMMDCKKALEEAGGDTEKAIDILRKKGQKVAANRSDRDAAEGVVIATTTADNGRAVMIVLNCETDFVAKNEDFGKTASTILNAAVSQNPASIDALKALPFGDSGISIDLKITEEIGKIGEKIELSAYESVNGTTTVAYNHPGNKLAAIVSFNKPIAADAARDVAMQVAAMAPVAVTPAEISAELVQKEKEIARDLAIQEGKPAEMADKIADGRIQKWYKEAALLEQAFIKDNKVSVAQYLKQLDSELTVTSFRRIALG